MEREWNFLKNKVVEGDIRVSYNPVAQAIVRGFKVLSMNMKDVDTDQILWTVSGDHFANIFDQEIEAHLPRKVLDSLMVSREIKFFSQETIENFRLEQKVFFEGAQV